MIACTQQAGSASTAPASPLSATATTGTAARAATCPTTTSASTGPAQSSATAPTPSAATSAPATGGTRAMGTSVKVGTVNNRYLWKHQPVKNPIQIRKLVWYFTECTDHATSTLNDSLTVLTLYFLFYMYVLKNG